MTSPLFSKKKDNLEKLYNKRFEARKSAISPPTDNDYTRYEYELTCAKILAVCDVYTTYAKNKYYPDNSVSAYKQHRDREQQITLLQELVESSTYSVDSLATTNVPAGNSTVVSLASEKCQNSQQKLLVNNISKKYIATSACINLIETIAEEKRFGVNTGKSSQLRQLLSNAIGYEKLEANIQPCQKKLMFEHYESYLEKKYIAQASRAQQAAQTSPDFLTDFSNKTKKLKPENYLDKNLSYTKKAYLSVKSTIAQLTKQLNNIKSITLSF